MIADTVHGERPHVATWGRADVVVASKILSRNLGLLGRFSLSFATQPS